ncbi:MAG: hypothetical protein K2Z81_04435 [Cyanobacteria bacterium]|nr:hypothetical protein [Cyanobacteriota bacterium]
MMVSDKGAPRAFVPLSFQVKQLRGTVGGVDIRHQRIGYSRHGRRISTRPRVSSFVRKHSLNVVQLELRSERKNK